MATANEGDIQESFVNVEVADLIETSLVAKSVDTTPVEEVEVSLPVVENVDNAADEIQEINDVEPVETQETLSFEAADALYGDLL